MEEGGGGGGGGINAILPEYSEKHKGKLMYLLVTI